MTSPSPPAEWAPDPAAFVSDLEAKPAALQRLAGDRDLSTAVGRVPRDVRRVLFLGMGSSRYAALTSARRLRACGLDAVAEYGSTQDLPPVDPGTLVVAISASGKSTETVEALGRYLGRATCVALTNAADPPLAAGADIVLPMLAGDEAGGVACRTCGHTGLILRLLESHLTGTALDFRGLCDRVAAATTDLLERRGEWLAPVSRLLDSPDGVHVIGPAERWSSVAQSALVFREGPRRPATASETGDWSHVDVYLTRTTDYRALLLAGSRYDQAAMEWMRRRGSTLVAVGGTVPGATHVLRYAGDDDPEIRLYTETLVADLVAAAWWQQATT